MKFPGCFNGTKTSYMPKDQGKFDFSCHDPFKGIVHPEMKIIQRFTHPLLEICRVRLVFPPPVSIYG